MTYLLYSLIIALVLGPQKWAPPHYAGLVGAPFVIYMVRRGITGFFDWRISQQEAHIEALQTQRETKIVDLKKATRYDSTQKLLQKYGGSGKPTASKSHQQPNQPPQQGTKRKITAANEAQRTGLPPPPTANIPGRIATFTPSTPPRPDVDVNPLSSATPNSPPSAMAFMDSPANIMANESEFAPNAFSNFPPPRPAYEQASKWYDRILDVLLGEDETLAKNRIALICSDCRLVNGQAPPGTRSLEELGKWKCGGCGAGNGVETGVAHAIQEMNQRLQDEQVGSQAPSSRGAPEESKRTQADGLTSLDANVPAVEEDVQGPAREIPDSEEDVDEEEEIQTGCYPDDNEEENKATKRPVTRSANKQTANKQR